MASPSPLEAPVIKIALWREVFPIVLNAPGLGFGGLVSPSLHQLNLDSELVADPGHDEVDEVIERSWLVIPAGHPRQDDRPGSGHGRHVLQVDEAQGRFARD